MWVREWMCSVQDNISGWVDTWACVWVTLKNPRWIVETDATIFICCQPICHQAGKSMRTRKQWRKRWFLEQIMSSGPFSCLCQTMLHNVIRKRKHLSYYSYHSLGTSSIHTLLFPWYPQTVTMASYTPAFKYMKPKIRSGWEEPLTNNFLGALIAF